MQPAIKVEQLNVHYDKVPVLWDIHFEIPQGLLVAVIGPNGAGKSTLLKALLHIVPSLSGLIEFLGLPLKKMRKRIAYVPQRSLIDWDFPITVEEVVLMGRYGKLGMFRRPSKADKEATLRALEQVGMLPFAKRHIRELSGGQQQRVFVARALLQEADIYLMDEPFAGVDVATEKEILAVLRTLKEEGKTLLIVHHDLTTVKSYFDWTILLNTCLIASGKVEDVVREEVLKRAYGTSAGILDEVAKLSSAKSSGLP